MFSFSFFIIMLKLRPVILKYPSIDRMNRLTGRKKVMMGDKKNERMNGGGMKSLAAWSAGKSPTELEALCLGGQMKCLISRWQDSVL